jgi:hypothetical protein
MARTNCGQHPPGKVDFLKGLVLCFNSLSILLCSNHEDRAETSNQYQQGLAEQGSMLKSKLPKKESEDDSQLKVSSHPFLSPQDNIGGIMRIAPSDENVSILS